MCLQGLSFGSLVPPLKSQSTGVQILEPIGPLSNLHLKLCMELASTTSLPNAFHLLNTLDTEKIVCYLTLNSVMFCGQLCAKER